MRDVDYPWTTKIDAFLHDPAHKALVLGSRWSHKEAAQVIAHALGIVGELDPREGPISQADRVAAAADRNTYLTRSREVYWKEQTALLTHPLGGEAFTLPAGLQKLATREEVEKIATELTQWMAKCKAKSDRDRYLWLWSRYFDETGSVLGKELAKYFPLLPADTRQPDHSLRQHLSMTAALAAALQEGYKPAFLIFGIGPVQEFIAAARRTADLWAGSWLLSFLTWKAIEAIIEEVGPDVIIFPSLREQPLAEAWFTGQITAGNLSSPTQNLRIASFPNRFVALLPYSEKNSSDPKAASSLTQKAEKAVHQAWKEIAHCVKKLIQSYSVGSWDNYTDSLWEAQVSSFPEVYWSIFPWPGNFSDGYNQTQEWWQNLTSTPLDAPPTLYSPNWGNAYAQLYLLAERFYGARKALRSSSENGEVFLGEVSSLHAGQIALSSENLSAKDWWAKLGDALRHKGIYLLQSEGQERLDALSTIKRFLPTLVKKSSSPKTTDSCASLFPPEMEFFTFPSNSEIAAAPFKQKVIDIYRKALLSAQPATPEQDKIHKAKQALQKFIEKLQEAQLLNRLCYDKPSLPAFQKIYDEEKDDTLKCFLALEASWLYETHWDENYLAREGIPVKENLRQEIQEALRALYKAADAHPAGYYAVLLMDGDHMGRWLSGTHEHMPHLREVVHADVSLEAETQRPVTPAYHAFISEALGHFALHFVPHIVEKHLGAVVYAGGDDVLAFLPVENALRAALELRAAFSGYLRYNGGTYAIDWTARSGYVDTEEKVFLTMGPRATASVGIAFAHHRMPLQTTLEEARQAEKEAKETYGRNAIALAILKRSGEAIRVGLPWLAQEGSSPFSSVEHFLHISQRLREESVSLRLGKLFAQEGEALTESPDMARSELRRVLRRRTPAPSEKLETDILRFFDFLWRWKGVSSQKDKVPSAVELFTEWMAVAAFLERGEV
ncbi:MAG: type III-B CRISPR-associated protein Cas10/Cmr2 [Bacteroidia bacterium]|nr:type III-B CRISPR-associated protein Cas10/Cmr2 [Bacteroidia bacterium]